MNVRAVILARFPVPGQCKTRLIPGFGGGGAAEIHRKLTERTVATLRESGVAFELWGTGGEEAQFRDWLGDISYREQPAGDLGARLSLAGEPYPAIFLGTDCPGLTPELVREAARHLDGGGEAVIGPAADGGYWLLGLSHPMPQLFTDMPWGTDKVFALTIDRLRAAGIEPRQLPVLSDIDHPEDLEPWPELRP